MSIENVDNNNKPSGISTGMDAAPEKTESFWMTYIMDLRGVTSVVFSMFSALLFAAALMYHDEANLAKSGGLPLNLYTAIGCLITAVLFGLWALKGVHEIIAESESATAQ